MHPHQGSLVPLERAALSRRPHLVAPLVDVRPHVPRLHLLVDAVVLPGGQHRHRRGVGGGPQLGHHLRDLRVGPRRVEDLGHPRPVARPVTRARGLPPLLLPGERRAQQRERLAAPRRGLQQRVGPGSEAPEVALHEDDLAPVRPEREVEVVPSDVQPGAPPLDPLHPPLDPGGLRRLRRLGGPGELRLPLRRPLRGPPVPLRGGGGPGPGRGQGGPGPGGLGAPYRLGGGVPLGRLRRGRRPPPAPPPWPGPRGLRGAGRGAPRGLEVVLAVVIRRRRRRGLRGRGGAHPRPPPHRRFRRPTPTPRTSAPPVKTARSDVSEVARTVFWKGALEKVAVPYLRREIPLHRLPLTPPGDEHYRHRARPIRHHGP